MAPSWTWTPVAVLVKGGYRVTVMIFGKGGLTSEWFLGTASKALRDTPAGSAAVGERSVVERQIGRLFVTSALEGG